MGRTIWSEDVHAWRAETRAAAGKDAFDYYRSVRAAGDLKVHKRLNPYGVKYRESRDSDIHPESLAIAVFLDVTGSMQLLPGIMIRKLGTLMALLIKKGYVNHPQILFGAIGDATCDRVPLQVGQFESGIEMDDDLSHLVLEGRGGPHDMESYELALYFMAYHTSIDCHEKRGKKGYLFIIGDEKHYPAVKANEVRYLIGDDLQTDMDFSEVAREVAKRYEVFIIRPNGSSHYYNSDITQSWKNHFSQNVILLEDAENIAEVIASTIGLSEGVVDLNGLKDDLAGIGATGKTIDSVTRALLPYAGGLVKSSGKAIVSGSLLTGDDAVSVEVL